MARLEFFFDCPSPWTYLAFHRIEEVVAEAGAELIWRPVLVGGVFNAVNRSVYEARAQPVPAKLRYYVKDLQDWAHSYGLRIGQPPVFPVNSVKAMRGCALALERGCVSRFARAPPAHSAPPRRCGSRAARSPSDAAVRACAA